MMIFCDVPILEEWIAPGNKGFVPRPTWTKLFANDFLVSNSIEFARWDSTPVEPIVCETCWESACGSCSLGLLFILRIGDYLLWAPPTADDVSLSNCDSYRRSIFRQRSLLMPVEVWNNLRKRFQNLPAADHFSAPRKTDLINLWFAEMPEDVRVDLPVNLTNRLTQEAIASDPLDLDDARHHVADLLAWMQFEPNAQVAGHLIRVRDFGGLLNSFFFDGPPFPEWQAFVVGPKQGLVFGNQWVFLID